MREVAMAGCLSATPRVECIKPTLLPTARTLSRALSLVERLVNATPFPGDH